MINQKKRKICVLVHSRANYGRIKSVLKAIMDHPQLELQLIVGCSALLHKYGNVREIIEKDGFKIDAQVYSVIEGENPTTMTKSTAITLLELATLFENMKPDIVLTVADRHETIATAIAASYMNIPLAHTQGGEVTGSIDESVRHAITKLAHIHFPATLRAKEFVIRMGEDPENVYHTGCPALDSILDLDLTLPPDIFERYKGIGAQLNSTKPYIVVLQHPVTTEYGDGHHQIQQTLKAISALKLQTVWIWPNADAGSDQISKELRMFHEQQKPSYLHFYRNFSVEDYLRLIYNAQCVVGNSSSVIREGSFLGVPAVNIGTRQMGREFAENIYQVNYSANEIEKAIEFQLRQGKYPSSKIYGDGHAGKRIADILAKAEIKIQKNLSYVKEYQTV